MRHIERANVAASFALIAVGMVASAGMAAGALASVDVPIAQPVAAATQQLFPLVAPQEVRAVGVSVSAVEHAGHRALRVVGAPDEAEYRLAVVAGAELRDGVIEVALAGRPLEGAAEGARGFVGIAFRAATDASRFECFYLRPTNGRAEDQLRRNHATQYIAHPGFPWQKLREESPGVYESYVDLVPGEWTNVRIEVAGTKARLFVHDAPQPVLVVNDLKLGPGAGTVALWIGPGTEAWFRDLRVTPAN
jgi:hypothetical protein